MSVVLAFPLVQAAAAAWSTAHLAVAAAVAPWAARAARESCGCADADALDLPAVPRPAAGGVAVAGVAGSESGDAADDAAAPPPAAPAAGNAAAPGAVSLDAAGECGRV